MPALISEDTTNSIRSSNPVGSYLDAMSRDKQARQIHRKLFDTDRHVDRVVGACDILKAFFGSSPNYITARGLGGRKPFESIKYEHVGRKLSRTPIYKKNKELYAPLLAMGDVEVISRNGHLTVRVY